MSVSILASVRPSFFVSYSRRQSDIAAPLRDLLRAYSTTWFDVDEIALGDDWRKEIAIAIDACDELVLLVSDDSLSSPVVAEELELAILAEKAIRAIVIRPLTGGVPERLKPFQYADVASDPTGPHILEALGLGTATHTMAAADWKRHDVRTLRFVACRGVWPCFDEALMKDPSIAGSIHTSLNSQLFRYPPSSTLRLNAGITGCLAGHWDAGLECLRSYAHAADTLAGWYYLAIHLPRRHPLHRIPPPLDREILSAAERATAFGSNPLLHLLRIVVDVELSNLRLTSQSRPLQLLKQAEAAQPERSSEYLRFYWCMKESISMLGDFQAAVTALIRGKRT